MGQGSAAAEGSYLTKWQAVVFLNLQNNRECIKGYNQFCLTNGRYEPSPPSTKELHDGLQLVFCQPRHDLI